MALHQPGLDRLGQIVRNKNHCERHPVDACRRQLERQQDSLHHQLHHWQKQQGSSSHQQPSLLQQQQQPRTWATRQAHINRQLDQHQAHPQQQQQQQQYQQQQPAHGDQQQTQSEALKQQSPAHHSWQPKAWIPWEHSHWQHLKTPLLLLLCIAFGLMLLLAPGLQHWCLARGLLQRAQAGVASVTWQYRYSSWRDIAAGNSGPLDSRVTPVAYCCLHGVNNGSSSTSSSPSHISAAVQAQQHRKTLSKLINTHAVGLEIINRSSHRTKGIGIGSNSSTTIKSSTSRRLLQQTARTSMTSAPTRAAATAAPATGGASDTTAALQSLAAVAVAASAVVLEALPTIWVQRYQKLDTGRTSKVTSNQQQQQQQQQSLPSPQRQQPRPPVKVSSNSGPPAAAPSYTVVPPTTTTSSSSSSSSSNSGSGSSSGEVPVVTYTGPMNSQLTVPPGSSGGSSSAGGVINISTSTPVTVINPINVTTPLQQTTVQQSGGAEGKLGGGVGEVLMMAAALRPRLVVVPVILPAG